MSELLSQRDAELLEERRERQRLASVLQSALSAERDLQDAMREADLSATRVAKGADKQTRFGALPPYRGTAQYGEQLDHDQENVPQQGRHAPPVEA